MLSKSSDRKVPFHDGVTVKNIDAADVASLLLTARHQSRVLAQDIADQAKLLAERAADIVALPNLPAGVHGSLDTIAKTLAEEVIKIEQQLEKSAKAPITIPSKAA